MRQLFFLLVRAVRRGKKRKILKLMHRWRFWFDPSRATASFHSHFETENSSQTGSAKTSFIVFVVCRSLSLRLSFNYLNYYTSQSIIRDIKKKKGISSAYHQQPKMGQYQAFWCGCGCDGQHAAYLPIFSSISLSLRVIYDSVCCFGNRVDPFFWQRHPF